MHYCHVFARRQIPICVDGYLALIFHPIFVVPIGRRATSHIDQDSGAIKHHKCNENFATHKKEHLLRLGGRAFNFFREKGGYELSKGSIYRQGDA